MSGPEDEELKRLALQGYCELASETLEEMGDNLREVKSKLLQIAEIFDNLSSSESESEKDRS